MAEELETLAVAVMGIGTIGRTLVRSIVREPGMTLIGALDTAPEFVGKRLSEIVAEAPAELRIESDLRALLARLKGGVLLVATTSSFEELQPVLEAAARAQVHVVSTCEELAFPWLNHEAAADALDRLASRNGVGILGTGVNPGFVLDRLAAVAGGAVGTVHHLSAVRQLAVTPELARRSPRRVAALGIGLSEEEFEARAGEGAIGLKGLNEAATLAALGLGLDPDEIEEELVPILAEEPLAALGIRTGQTAGICQKVRGFVEGREVVSLEVTFSADIESPQDRITLDAEPKIELIIQGGYPSDAATAWAVVRAALQLPRCEPGIVTVLDLPAGR